MKILNIWEEFKKTINVNDEYFNTGIETNINTLLTDELYCILKKSNGQKADTLPIFGEFTTGLLGIQNRYYKFLSFQEILEIIDEMDNFDKAKSIDLIPFAIYRTIFSDEIKTYIFSIEKKSKMIYKIYFFYWEKFVSHKEFQSVKIAENLEEFINNQIVWYREGYLKRLLPN